MRIVRLGVATSMLWTAASIVAAQQSSAVFPAGTGSISGQVVAADTGKPLPSAVVEIVIFNNLSSRFRQVVSDAQGRFEFTALPAGHYEIAASAPRYVRMMYGQQKPGPAGVLNPQRAIELAEAQVFTTADFRLAHFSAIEGTVVDEFGDPVPNVTMQASQLQNAGGRRRLVPVASSADAGPPRPTDDKGQFRIGGLPPGDYYVEALSGAFASPDATGGFAMTFYPGTADAASARVVRLEPGHDATNLTFALTPAPTVPVAGALVDADGHPIAGGNLTLMPSERTGTALFMVVRSVASENGRFSFRNLPPGEYTLQAYGAPVGRGGNLGAYAFGYLTFAVDGHDTSHLTVTVPAPRTLRGHIVFEGSAPTLKPGDVSISAMPIDFESAPIGGGPAPFTVHDDWSFEVLAMSGLRVVSASGRPAWRLERATLDGRDVTDTPLDFREHDVDGLELLLTTETTTVTATLDGLDGRSVADYNVLIFANDEAKWTLFSRYVALVRPGQQGVFTLKGLPPGSYTAVAVDTLANGEWQDPEFLRVERASPTAARFTLNAGESKTTALTVKR